MQDASTTTAATYEDMNDQIKLIIDKSLPIMSNLANVASILFWNLNSQNRQVNWAGFYFLDEKQNKLFLGPFQGKVACTTIPLGKGVCGTAAKERASVVVENVHNFAGHIACDSASESEIVIPLLGSTGECLGVIDIDSLRLGEFNNVDRKGLEEVAKTVSLYLGDTDSAKDLLLLR